MKQSDLNHLRRLLGWIRCEIGQSPAELQQTLIDIADGLGHPEISPEAKARMVETYRRAESIPLYVRAAVKALEKVLAGSSRPAPAAAGAGREGGAEEPRRSAETRANIGLDPGAGAGREPVADDLVASLRSMASVAPASECEILLAAASALASAPVARPPVCAIKSIDLSKISLSSPRAAGLAAGMLSDQFAELGQDGLPPLPEHFSLCDEDDAKASPRAVAALCAELAAVRQQLAQLVAECSRADAQAGREVQRTFIYPEVLERARQVLAVQTHEGELC